MSKLYPRQKRKPKVVSIDMTNKEVATLTKTVAKLVKDSDAQRRTIFKLDKQNKYLKDRIANAEQKLSYLNRIVNTLENNVNKVMGIFRR